VNVHGILSCARNGVRPIARNLRLLAAVIVAMPDGILVPAWPGPHLLAAPEVTWPRAAVPDLWLPAWLPVIEDRIEIYTLSCAPSKTRTCGLLLRRHNRYVAGWRCTWLHVPFACTDNRWTVLGVA
jgi:hypothetical protein